MKHAKTLFVTLLALLFCTVLAGCGSKIDAMNYVDLTFSGSNGAGRADLTVRSLALIESIIGKEPELNESYTKWLNQYILYDEGITVSCSPNQNLSNGDTVTVTITLSDAVAKAVIGGKKTFTVNGLPEMQTIDFFQDVALRYEGIGADAHAILERLSSEAILQECNFSIDPEFSIHNGDTVSVTITNAEYMEQEYLCHPAVLSKSFQVSGLDEYLTDTDLLPEADIQELIRQFLSQSQPEDDSVFTYSAPQYYKTYFLIKDPASYYLADSENALEIYICYDAYMNGTYHQTIYTPLVFQNLILHPDGSVDGLDYSSGISTTFYTDSDQITNRAFSAYTIEEVYIDY